MDPAELQSFLRPYADADKPDTHWLSELGLQSDPRSSGSNSASASGAASPRTPGTRPTSGSQQRQLNAVSIQLRGRVARSAFEDMFNRIAAAEAELRRLGENPYTPGHEGKSKLAILERRLDAVKRAHAGREVVRRRYAEAPTGKIPKYVSFQVMRCFTRLQAAHQAKDVEGMLCAVEAGAPCDAMFLNGETVLTTLVRMRSSGAVERLLAAGADPNATNADGVTASAIALVNGDAATVRILCACQATEPSALVPLALEDGDDATPVMVSIARGQVTAITLLLRNKRLDVNRRNSKLRTALMFAARFQNADAMVELLRVGARTRRTDNLGYNAIDWLRASVEYHAARSSLEESLSTTAIPSVGGGAGKTLEAALKSQFKNVTGLDITPDVEAMASRLPGVAQWLPSERHLLHMLLAVWHEEGYGSYVPLHVDALPSLDWWPAARFQTHFGVHEHKSAAAAAATAASVAGLVATATPNTQQLANSITAPLAADAAHGRKHVHEAVEMPPAAAARRQYAPGGMKTAVSRSASMDAGEGGAAAVVARCDVCAFRCAHLFRCLECCQNMCAGCAQRTHAHADRAWHSVRPPPKNNVGDRAALSASGSAALLGAEVLQPGSTSSVSAQRALHDLHLLDLFHPVRKSAVERVEEELAMRHKSKVNQMAAVPDMVTAAAHTVLNDGKQADAKTLLHFYSARQRHADELDGRLVSTRLLGVLGDKTNSSLRARLLAKAGMATQSGPSVHAPPAILAVIERARAASKSGGSPRSKPESPSPRAVPHSDMAPEDAASLAFRDASLPPLLISPAAMRLPHGAPPDRRLSAAAQVEPCSDLVETLDAGAASQLAQAPPAPARVLATRRASDVQPQTSVPRAHRRSSVNCAPLGEMAAAQQPPHAAARRGSLVIMQHAAALVALEGTLHAAERRVQETQHALHTKQCDSASTADAIAAAAAADVAAARQLHALVAAEQASIEAADAETLGIASGSSTPPLTEAWGVADAGGGADAQLVTDMADAYHALHVEEWKRHHANETRGSAHRRVSNARVQTPPQRRRSVAQDHARRASVQELNAHLLLAAANKYVEQVGNAGIGGDEVQAADVKLPVVLAAAHDTAARRRSSSATIQVTRSQGAHVIGAEDNADTAHVFLDATSTTSRRRGSVLDLSSDARAKPLLAISQARMEAAVLHKQAGNVHTASEQHETTGEHTERTREVDLEAFQTHQALAFDATAHYRAVGSAVLGDAQARAVDDCKGLPETMGDACVALGTRVQQEDTTRTPPSHDTRGSSRADAVREEWTLPTPPTDGAPSMPDSAQRSEPSSAAAQAGARLWNKAAAAPTDVLDLEAGQRADALFHGGEYEAAAATLRALALELRSRLPASVPALTSCFIQLAKCHRVQRKIRDAQSALLAAERLLMPAQHADWWLALHVSATEEKCLCMLYMRSYESVAVHVRWLLGNHEHAIRALPAPFAVPATAGKSWHAQALESAPYTRLCRLADIAVPIVECAAMAEEDALAQARRRVLQERAQRAAELRAQAEASASVAAAAKVTSPLAVLLGAVPQRVAQAVLASVSPADAADAASPAARPMSPVSKEAIRLASPYTMNLGSLGLPPLVTRSITVSSRRSARSPPSSRGGARTPPSADGRRARVGTARADVRPITRDGVLNLLQMELQRRVHAAVIIQRLVRGHITRTRVARTFNTCWVPRTDEASGYAYYYNVTSGESRWCLPAFLRPGTVHAKAMCLTCECQLAAEYCHDCGESYCATCAAATHDGASATRSQGSHLRMPLTLQDAVCGDCETRLGTHYCAQCETAYCRHCHAHMRARAARASHPFVWMPRIQALLASAAAQGKRSTR